jgi:peptidoglycan hydrolase-like protein with peptidoglycan-binding domain
VGYDIAKQTTKVGGGGTVGQPQLAIGKQTLVEQFDHEEPQQGDSPLEAPSSGSLAAIRFNADPDLLAVADGKKTLAPGANGIAVTKVQRALVELGQPVTLTGTLDASTVTALKAFQHTKAIAETGSVDKPTMLALDAAFTDYSVEGKLLKGLKPSTKPTEGKPYDVGKAPKELLAATHAPDAAERTALADALSTETKADPKTGTPPKFVEVVGGQNYGDRIEAAVNKVIDTQLAWAKPMENDRKAGHLYDWGNIEKVGVQSKTATDASFGSYATGKALKATGVDAKIKDAWEFKEKELAADPGAAGEAASWRVTKILDGHASISAIDSEHGAIQSHAAEKAIVDPIHAKIATARKAELVLIHKAWPAFASGNDVFIQRIEKHDAKGHFDKADGRNYMWKTFQTIIHEYIHTLEHPAHQAYRAKLPAQKGGFTLREGTTDYFTKIAYNNTDRADPTLRTNVEGPFHEPAVVHPIPPLTTYRESANAERAAGIVGLPNLCGAFFLGQLELIGKV